jgi:hypothetical protein
MPELVRSQTERRKPEIENFNTGYEYAVEMGFIRAMNENLAGSQIESSAAAAFLQPAGHDNRCKGFGMPVARNVGAARNFFSRIGRMPVRTDIKFSGAYIYDINCSSHRRTTLPKASKYLSIALCK